MRNMAKVTTRRFLQGADAVCEQKHVSLGHRGWTNLCIFLLFPDHDHCWFSRRSPGGGATLICLSGTVGKNDGIAGGAASALRLGGRHGCKVQPPVRTSRFGRPSVCFFLPSWRRR